MSDISFNVEAQTGPAIGQFNQLFNVVNSGLKSIEKESAQAESFLTRLGNGFKQIGAIATALKSSIEPFVQLTREAINTADAVGKAARATDISVRTMDGLRRQGAVSGVGFDKVSEGLGKFHEKVVQAQQEGGKALEVFRSLGGGLDTMVASGASTESVLLAVAQRFSELNDSQLQSTAANQLFGESNTALIPVLSAGANELQRMADVSPLDEEKAAAATRFNEVMGRLQLILEDVFLHLVADLLPILEQFARTLLETGENSGFAAGVATTLGHIFRGFVVVVDFVRTILSSLATMIAGTVVTALSVLGNSFRGLTQLASLWFDNLRAIWDLLGNLVGRVRNVGSFMTALLDGDFSKAADIAGNTVVGNAKDLLQTFERVKNNAKQAIDVGVSTIQGNFQIVKDQGMLVFEELRAKWKDGFWNNTLNLFTPTASWTPLVIPPRKPGVKNPTGTGDAKPPEGDVVGKLERTTSVIKEQKKQVDELITKSNVVSQKLSAGLDSIYKGFQSGLKDGLDKLLQQAQTVDQFFQGLGLSVLNSMRNAFTQMVSDWITKHVVMKAVSFAFNKFLSVLGWQRVAESNAQETAKTPALGNNALLASIGSFGLAVLIGVAAIAGIMAATAREHGGPVRAGRPYLVGEAGPELVIPQRDGMVLPADISARVMGAVSARAQSGHGSTGNTQLSPSRPQRIIVVDDARMVRDLNSDPGFENVVVELMGKNMWRFRS